MKNKNVVLTSPLAGEDARRAGEGDIKENPYLTPSSVCSDFVRQTTSPAQGGSHTTNGFTLIELLVVVLIIGILAAVAVPQYQFAVDKSRVIPYLSVIQDIVKAEQIYYMANGTYTQRFEDMDIDITNMCPTMYGENEVVNCAGNISLTIFNYATYTSLYLVYCAGKECSYSYANNNNALLRAYFNVSTGKFISCTPYNNSTRGQKLCNWLTQQFQ